jgi:hypothetical protein
MQQKLIAVFREYGVLLGLLYGFDRLLQRLSPRWRLYAYHIMVQPITDKPLLPPRFSKRLEIREIKRGDPEVEMMPARTEIKEARFAQNAVCLGAFRDGRFIGYMWFCYRAYEEDEVRCTYLATPEDQSVFDFDLYVFPEYRMGLAFAAIWNGANQYLRAKGVKFTFSRLTQFNLPSRRAHDHLGWKRVGRALFLQAGPIEFMAATLRPYLHVSCTTAKRVQLRLHPDVLEAQGPMDLREGEQV